MDRRVLLFLLLIIVLAAAARLLSLRFNMLMEPDEYYHLRTAEYILHSGVAIPHYLDFSGYPVHAIVMEPVTFYWMIIALSAVMGSVFNVFLYLPVILGVAYVALSGLLAMQLNKDYRFVLLAMLLVAASGANIVRTTAGELRGDTLAPLFLMVSMLMTTRMLKARRHMALYSVSIGVMMSFSYLAWRGGIFVPGVFVLFALVFILSGYMIGRRTFLTDSLYVLAGLVVFSVMAKLYYAIRLITVTYPLASGFYVPLFAMSSFAFVAFLLYFAGNAGAKKKVAYSLVFLMVCLALGVAMLHLSANLPQRFDNLSLLGNRIFQTVAELQPTQIGSANLLGTSLLSPVGIAFLIGSLFGRYGLIFLAAIALLCTMYLFMGFRSGRPAIRLDVRPEWLLVISYLIITAALAFSSLRFVYLLSIPLAITTAYTMFWALEYFKKDTGEGRLVRFVVMVAVVFSPVVGMSYGYLMQGADVSSGLLASMHWINNHTPANAVVLTSWWDGSVVEGAANRTSVTDSVGAQNSNAVYLFSDWLYSNYTNASIFYAMGKPDYLFARQGWLNNSFSFGYPIGRPGAFPSNSNANAIIYGCDGACQVDNGLVRFTKVYSGNGSVIYEINYTGGG